MQEEENHLFAVHHYEDEEKEEKGKKAEAPSEPETAVPEPKAITQSAERLASQIASPLPPHSIPS